jgi:hypothetical protein
VNVIVQDGGIYVTNGENGTYSVVNLKGTVLANGRIDSASRFISLSDMTRGGVYIVMVERNGVRKSMKFIK